MTDKPAWVCPNCNRTSNPPFTYDHKLTMDYQFRQMDHATRSEAIRCLENECQKITNNFAWILERFKQKSTVRSRWVDVMFRDYVDILHNITVDRAKQNNLGLRYGKRVDTFVRGGWAPYVELNFDPINWVYLDTEASRDHYNTTTVCPICGHTERYWNQALVDCYLREPKDA